MKVEEYVAEDGKNHYKEWFDALAAEYAAKAAAARARMMAGSFGNVNLLMGCSKNTALIGGREYGFT